LSKIGSQHLDRRACVYVRQSSMAQVQHHQESAQRQYNLRQRAAVLGWHDIEVIDDDQGRSGSSADGRDGFQRLVSDVAMGKVGAVFGLEVSRLARSCVDWYRLLEVAALSGTLIVDEDGVYDPRHYNDRLLLGLKGTLSEAELHLLKSRMMGGRRNKARRGAFRIRLPIGYIWEKGEGIRLDPDERVREAVHVFFRSFERIGSILGTVRFFDDNRLLFPRRDGWGSLEAAVTWGILDVSRAAQLLHNPLYAGIYAYDRRSDRVEDPEDPAAGGRILISSSHPSYITMEQFERNQGRLTANWTMSAWVRQKGTPREGISLLQGIALCGRCGRHMYVRYRGEDVLYVCRDGRTRRGCQLIVGRDVEPLIEKVLLEAVSREELELAVEATKRIAGRAQELDQQWQKRIEAARYEAEKASRRYHQTEPENRLVARTLEKEWNTCLEEVEGIEREYERVRKQPPFELTGSQRQRILALSKDLPELWHARTTTNSQRKQVTRLLLEDVTLKNIDCPWSVDVAIRWKTGAVTRYRAERINPRPRTTSRDVVARIQELAVEKTDREIAEMLNREGCTTGAGKAFTETSVAHIRHRRRMVCLRTTRKDLVGRIAELFPQMTDAQIAESLNAEGWRNGFGKPLTSSAITHIRFKLGWKKKTRPRQHD